MATGREIKQIYDSMRRICEETSRMLTALHDNFVNRRGLVFAFPNRSVTWGTSTSYSEPRSWLPYFQQMVFRTRDANTKQGVGVNVMFDEYGGNLGNSIPFVSCGLLVWNGPGCVGKCDEFYEAGWHRQAVGTTIVEHSPLYTTTFTGRNICEIVNYFLPLDVIVSEEALDSLIVTPLIDLLEGRHDRAVERVRGVAITVEALKSTGSE